MSIESDISDSIKPSLVPLVFIFLKLTGIILNLRITKVAKINGSFQVLYFSKIFQKYLNVIFMLRSSLILILILITSPFPLQISPASSIVIRNPFNREQLGTKHCWLHHSIPWKRSTMIEREGYRRSSAKSARKNVHFPRHSSRHPIGRRVPEADTAFARECLSRSRKAAERESEEEGRKREKKKEREKGPGGIVGPSRSKSHAFRQSSVWRGAYKRQQPRCSIPTFSPCAFYHQKPRCGTPISYSTSTYPTRSSRGHKQEINSSKWGQSSSECDLSAIYTKHSTVIVKNIGSNHWKFD